MHSNKCHMTLNESLYMSKMFNMLDKLQVCSHVLLNDFSSSRAAMDYSDLISVVILRVESMSNNPSSSFKADKYGRWHRGL